MIRIYIYIHFYACDSVRCTHITMITSFPIMANFCIHHVFYYFCCFAEATCVCVSYHHPLALRVDGNRVSSVCVCSCLVSPLGIESRVCVSSWLSEPSLVSTHARSGRKIFNTSASSWLSEPSLVSTLGSNMAVAFLYNRQLKGDTGQRVFSLALGGAPFRIVSDVAPLFILQKPTDLSNAGSVSASVSVGVLAASVEALGDALAGNWGMTYVTELGSALCVARDATLEAGTDGETADGDTSAILQSVDSDLFPDGVDAKKSSSTSARWIELRTCWTERESSTSMGKAHCMLSQTSHPKFVGYV